MFEFDTVNFIFQKGHFILYNLKNRFFFKKGRAFYWASRTAAPIEKGVSFSSKIRESGVFFKLGYEHGIRFGRERDAGDGVSEGEFTRALLLTQITNHMPGKVWD